jgi:threonine synthase
MSSRGPRTWQQCDACGATHDELMAATRCPACNGLLAVRHAPPTHGAAELRRLFAEPCCVRAGPPASGVWRFKELVLPTATAPVSHPEGNTPLLERPAVSAFSGVADLRLKHEGHNPTGSFKDRGMTVGITQAVRVGATAVACASTGNTSASLAAYAAQAGLKALVFVPRDGIALGKLAQSLAYGARTLLVRGNFDDCLRLVEEASRELGVYLVNSINPFRLEGQKTIVLELLQQLGWEAPDWIAVPAGNLGNTAAFGKALVEAHALGLIDRIPRIAAVQAAGAAPFALGFAEGFAHRHTVKPETVATAIKIGDPASWDRAVRTMIDTRGVVLGVPDGEILEAKAVIDASGVGCEPASAASVAGVRRLVEAGVIEREARVVAVLTGHVLKDPGILLEYHREQEPAPPRANRPVEIEPTLTAVEAVLRS